MRDPRGVTERYPGGVIAPADPEARRLVEELGLAPHPEGGFYRETFRSSARIATARGERAALTVIHYLLPAGARSALHRVASDELWQHAAGGPLELHVVSPTGAHAALRLGREVAAGDLAHAVVPAGHWQAARPLGDRCALVTCAVAPGFEFADFQLASPGELSRAFPHLAALAEAFAS